MSAADPTQPTASSERPAADGGASTPPRLGTVRVAGPVDAIGAPSPKGVALGPPGAPWGVRPVRVLGALVVTATTVLAVLAVARSGASTVDSVPGPNMVETVPTTTAPRPTLVLPLPPEQTAPTPTFDRVAALLEAGRQAATTVPTTVAVRLRSTDPAPPAEATVTVPPSTSAPVPATTVAPPPPTTASPPTTVPPTTARPQPAVSTRPTVTVAPPTTPVTTAPPVTTRDDRGRNRRGRDEDDD